MTSSDASPAGPPRQPPSLRRRMFVGTASNLATQAFLMIVNLALTPFIIREVGATAFGLWILAGSIASVGGLLDLGMSAALVKFVAEGNARGDRDEAARMVGAAAWLYAVLGVAGAAVTTGLAFVLPAAMHVPEASRDTATLLMIGVALGLLLGLPTIAPVSVLRGLHRFPTVNSISISATVLNLVVVIVVLIAGVGVLGLAVAALLSGVLNLVLAMRAAKRAAPEITLRLVRRDPARLRRLIAFSAPISVIQIAGRLQLKIDAIVIGAALPIRFLTPYGLAQRLAEGTRTVTDQFTRILLPVATEVATARGAADIRLLLLTSTRLTLLMALGVGTPLILLGGEVLQAWVGPAYRPYGDVVALLAASAVIDISSYPGAAALQGLARHKPLAWMSLLSGVVNLGLSILLVSPLGVRGVALATLSTTAAEITLLVMPYVGRVVGVSAGAAAKDVLARLLPAVAVYALLLEGASHLFEVTSLLRLALVVLVSGGAYMLVYACVGASGYERRFVRSAIGRIPRWRAA